MADGVFNIAKGRVVELYNRVKSNDPANSAFVIVLCTGTEADDTIRDADTLTALLATSLSEATFTNYARKTLTDSDLAALPDPDDGSNRYDLDIPDQTWTSAGGTTDNTLTRLIICYDPDTTGGTDANIIPLCFYDFALTTQGTSFTAEVNTSGFYRAS